MRIKQGLLWMMGLLLIIHRAHSATLIWTNTAGGDWSVAANWSPNQVPGSSDNAFITNSGSYTVTLNAQATVNSLSLAQTLAWSGGGLAGAVTVATNGVLNIINTGYADLGSCTLTNYGTVNWVTGTLQGGGTPGTTIDNYGLWNVQDDSTINHNDGGDAIAFNNYGTFLKSAGSTNSSTILRGGVNFTNTGTIDAASGSLVWQGSLTTTGNLIGNTNVNGGIFVDGTLNGYSLIAGPLNLEGGNIAGAVTVATNGILNIIISSGYLDLSGCILTNSGTVNWVTGTLQGGGTPGTTIDNYGLWNVQDDSSINHNDGGDAIAFNNYGTFLKSAGSTNSSTILRGGVNFTNTGTIDVASGSLVWQGSLTTTGNLIGNTNVNGGIFVDGTLNGYSLIAGPLNLEGGNIAGAVTVATNGILNIIISSGYLDLSGCILTNSGTVNWVTGTLQGGGTPGTTIDNYGLWNVQDDSSINHNDGGDAIAFNNYGTFLKSAGSTNSSTFFVGDVNFTNTGTIDAASGSLVWLGGCSLTTTGNLIGNTNVNGGIFVDGTLNGYSLIAGPLNLEGGNIAGAVTVATNGILNIIISSGYLDLSGCILTNSGTVNWVTGTLQGGGTPGTTIDNYGLWNVQDDSSINHNDGGDAIAFNNYGTFLKSAGSATGGTVLQGGVDFTNYGRMDMQAGNVTLQGGYNLTNGTLNFGINGLTNYGTISLSGIAPLSSTISANLNNGYIPVRGNSFTNLYYGSYTGGFTNTVLPFADAWTTNYFPTYYVMTVLNARPVLAPLATNLFIINELTALSVTNTATDPNVPAETLSYSLASGLPGMTVNSATGVFAWTPPQTNSPSTNLVSVGVANNGTPPLSATNTFTVIVKEVNQPPTLPIVVTQIVNELTLLTVTNTASETNIHSATTGYTLVNPLPGMSIDTNGIITWTPAQTQSPGTNLITTIVTNSNPYDLVNPVLMATNIFTVIVREVNVAPSLPVVPTQTVNELTLLTVTNTASESNIHSTISGYALLNPLPGMSISANGIFTWAPTQTQSPGTNLVTTIVRNSNPYDLVNPVLASTNTFTVIVKEVNVAPVLPVIATQTVNELTLLTVTNTATDSNIHATVDYALINPPAGAVIDANGIITWTPTQAQSPGTNTITTIATSTDNYDLINPEMTVTNNFIVFVKEVNVAPVLPVIATQTVNELTMLTVTNAATDSNIHATVGYTLLAGPAGVSISTNGVITWTPSQSQSPGTNTITTVATSTDNFDLVNPQLTVTNSFTVIVKEVNVAPVLPVIATQTVNELNLLTVTNAATDSNIHSTVGYALVNPPAGMAVGTNGVITWTPSQTESPGTNTVTTIATSTNNFDQVNPQLSVTNTFTVIVKEVNVAPLLPVIATQTVNELTLLTVTNTATDSNTHSTLAYALLNPPAGAAISTNGLITWTPSQNQSPGTNIITTVATSTDNFDLVNPQLSVTNSFTVIVTEVNVAPVLEVVPTQTVNELTLLTVTNTATDSNIHTTIGYALLAAPAGVSISTNGVITWTPSQSQSPGTNTITTVATSTDNFDLVNPQLTATNSFTVIVKEVNVAPVLPVVATQTVNELTLLTVTNTATDSNIHATVGYALLAAPAGVSISTNGVITWTPSQSQSPGTNTITTVAKSTDNYDMVNPQLNVTNSFTVIVKEVNVAPILPIIPTQTVNELTMLTVTNMATDSNIHATVGYALLTAPAGVSISTNGVITWTPIQNQSPGTNTITTVATSTDNYDLVNPQLSVTNSFTVIVQEVNVAPVLPAIPTQIVYELTLMTVNNSATETNIHATLAYTLVNPPAGASINPSGVITWTPSAAQSPGTNIITTIVTATDGFDAVHPALSATNSFTVIVRPAIILSGATWLGNDQFQFSFNTTEGQDYTIQYSTNLISWTSVLELEGDGSSYTIIDPNASGPQRFYRIISP